MSIVKSRWLKIDTEYSESEIFELISAYNYTQDSLSGFINVNYIQNIIEARFVEKISIIQYITDPFGNETEQVINSYNHIDFRFIDNNYIEILSPPRSIKNLTKFLSKIFNHGLFISALKIDLKEALKKSISSLDGIIVQKAKVSGLKIGKKGLASVEVKSISDALDDLHYFSKDSEYMLDKVSGIAILDTEKFEFEIIKQGLLSCDEDFHDKMIHIFVI